MMSGCFIFQIPTIIINACVLQTDPPEINYPAPILLYDYPIEYIVPFVRELID